MSSARYASITETASTEYPSWHRDGNVKVALDAIAKTIIRWIEPRSSCISSYKPH
jgi:hypothetical protein